MPISKKTVNECIFEIKGDTEVVRISFYKVPALVVKKLGIIEIDWGDGPSERINCTIGDRDLHQMVNDTSYTATLDIVHRYEKASDRQIRIKTQSGFLPLAQLPYQTVAIDTALPTLTLGQTNVKGEILPSDTLPKLVPDDDTGRSRLRRITGILFAANPQLTYFDHAFSHSNLSELEVELFDPIEKIRSLEETFSQTPIHTIHEGLLKNANKRTYAKRTFAGCNSLKSIQNPFGAEIPIVINGFLEGVRSRNIDWADFRLREKMGFVHRKTNARDCAFVVKWLPKSTETPETILSFYPIDLKLNGELLIDWGDGSNEHVDFDSKETLTHRWKDLIEKEIRIFYLPHEPVQPFFMGKNVTAFLSPLPKFHPRSVEQKGDFCGWACNRRLLRSVAKDFFVNNPEITNLEQAFAGCLNLTEVPDNLLSPLANLSNVDGMFAECKKLKRLPKSFQTHPRDKSLDRFVLKGDE